MLNFNLTSPPVLLSLYFSSFINEKIHFRWVLTLKVSKILDFQQLLVLVIWSPGVYSRIILSRTSSSSTDKPDQHSYIEIETRSKRPTDANSKRNKLCVYLRIDFRICDSKDHQELGRNVISFVRGLHQKSIWLQFWYPQLNEKQKIFT